MEKQTSVTSTSSKSLEIYSPKNLRITYREVTTVEQALAVKSKSLLSLKNMYSPEKIAALIKLQLIELNELLNLKRPLTEQQIDAIADEILTQWHYLTMADIYLIMRRAKTGYYGEFYESITMPKVLTWFRDYFDERCDESERLSIQEASNYKVEGERVSKMNKADYNAFKSKYMVDSFSEKTEETQKTESNV